MITKNSTMECWAENWVESEKKWPFKRGLKEYLKTLGASLSPPPPPPPQSVFKCECLGEGVRTFGGYTSSCSQLIGTGESQGAPLFQRWGTGSLRPRSVELAADTPGNQVSPRGDREDGPELQLRLRPGRPRNRRSLPTASFQPPFGSNPEQKLPNTDLWKFSRT